MASGQQELSAFTAVIGKPHSHRKQPSAGICAKLAAAQVVSMKLLLFQKSLVQQFLLPGFPRARALQNRRMIYGYARVAEHHHLRLSK